MNKWELDVAVLCIFFARPEQFRQSFEQVRKARPRVLLLWQDGPREGRPDDNEKILECRKIAENIDWECEVHQNYHSLNMGCDPSTHFSHKWAFSIVDKCIILEDDLVPSQSFFRFCKEMLDKYENDERISRICGTNLLGKYEIPYDYFFSRYGNSHGWASWKRVAVKWNTEYDFLDDEYVASCLEKCGGKENQQKKWIASCKRKKEQTIPYWEEIVGAETLCESQLIIYPSVNLISDIGIDVNSTHAPADKRFLAKETRSLFNMKRHELSWPLIAPKYVIEDNIYIERCSSKKTNCISRLSGLLNKIRYGGAKEVSKTIRRKLGR